MTDEQKARVMNNFINEARGTEELALKMTNFEIRTSIVVLGRSLRLHEKQIQQWLEKPLN